ncbi:MAG: hypothetical protein LBP52_04185 [Burkholderiaceae bacterium]|nr:hypothetical protein [Burkholderiaceae bacterium]
MAFNQTFPGSSGAPMLKWLGAIVLALLGLSAHAAQSLAVLAEARVAESSRDLSLLKVGDAAPSIVVLELGEDEEAMSARVVPFDAVGAAAAPARQPLARFGDAMFAAHEHVFDKTTPVALAVADAVAARWRLQPINGKAALQLPEGVFVRGVVGKNGRYALAGISSSDAPWLVVTGQKSGVLAAGSNLMDGAKKGEVSQLVNLPGDEYLAVVNYGDATAELMLWSGAGKLLRRQSVPGGAASVARSADGLLLVAYRVKRQWFAAQWNARWKTMWTRPLWPDSGPDTRTLLLAPMGRKGGWWVAGGLKGALFVRALGTDGVLQEMLTESSTLTPPEDGNLHLWVQDDGRLLMRGVTERKSDIRAGKYTSIDFVLTPR